MSVLRLRCDTEREERERLGPWAVRSAESAGRVVPEPEHRHRTAFQRDRDRVVHSRAFRRLEYKTQVFVHREGEHYRDRLTHTLEATQIARTIARALRLNEDLAEAIVLAHDLGHTPFGHAGERALDRLMKGHGGFDHNRQSLRVVDLLEERYPGFRGLNLTAETREGILKHGVRWEHPVPLPPLGRQPALEAQVADASDEIAYTNHDLDDGLRSGLLTGRQLEEAPLWGATHHAVRGRIGEAPERVLYAQTIRALIDRLVTDLLEASAERIAAAAPRSAQEVREADAPLIGFSPEVTRSARGLKRFLFENLYHHPQVLRMNRSGERVLKDLFETYRGEPELLPAHVRARFTQDGEVRVIADYVAGMTDRFALAEHAKLSGLHVLA